MRQLLERPCELFFGLTRKKMAGKKMTILEYSYKRDVISGPIDLKAT
jgi:hypothetical protein